MTFKRFFAVLALIAVAPIVQAEQPLKDKEKQNHLLFFVVGSYQVVGQQIETGVPYAGKMTIVRSGNKLIANRVINGKNTKAEGVILGSGPDNIPILQLSFTDNGKKIKSTYKIDSDFDNYARLTGHVYFDGQETKQPGLEALFFSEESR